MLLSLDVALELGVDAKPGGLSFLDRRFGFADPSCQQIDDSEVVVSLPELGVDSESRQVLTLRIGEVAASEVRTTESERYFCRCLELLGR